MLQEKLTFLSEVREKGTLIGVGTEADVYLFEGRAYKYFFYANHPTAKELEASYNLVRNAFPSYPCLYQVEVEGVVSCPYIKGRHPTNQDAQLISNHLKEWKSKGIKHLDWLNPKNVLITENNGVVFIDHDYVESI